MRWNPGGLAAETLQTQGSASMCVHLEGHAGVLNRLAADRLSAPVGEACVQPAWFPDT